MSLAAELQAELQARQEQYEYYRNKLLTFEKMQKGWNGRGYQIYARILTEDVNQ